MGAFYGNITLTGVKPDQVAKTLRGRRAITASSVSNHVVVFDSVCDAQEIEAMQSLAAQITHELSCHALAILVHDDDVLVYYLFRNGKLIDSYNSCPSYFEFGSTKNAAAPEGGKAKLLVKAFGHGDHTKLELILRKPKGRQGYVLETKRHADLAKGLSLPQFAVGTALASFERGEYPAGITKHDFEWAEDAPSPELDKQRREDWSFYNSLGDEDLSRPCKHEGCKRGAIQFGVLCKRHHFEMLHERDCPFDNN